MGVAIIPDHIVFTSPEKNTAEYTEYLRMRKQWIPGALSPPAQRLEPRLLQVMKKFHNQYYFKTQFGKQDDL